MTRVFVSYCHADEQYRAELDKHLSLLRRQGHVDVWNDHRIPAGGEIETHISAELDAADLIILLVSSDFMNSDYCYGIEMQRALERHQEGSAVVVPIIVRPCDWTSSPLGRLKALPKDARPITKWPTLDDAFVDIVQSLRKLLTAKTQSGAQSASSRPSSHLPAPHAAVSAMHPRSGTLFLPKEFRDIDRDNFLTNAFNYISAFFENSLQELAPRNPGYECRFRRISELGFTGAIYRDGKKVAGCYIRITHTYGSRGQIGYSGNDSAQESSFNEILSVDADDQSMYLRGLMMHGAGHEQKLTSEGAAEQLWQLLLDQVR
ncbi:toll/interleukin-1 receptor domain-containing protein [Burkholderia contaminans]|uniref:toll/interleukin-1 receptor domain-containing protein n=1 Tax=Burkholderia contaminans TaxID=488447 RepID=UPI000F5AADAC|nr:toll/interleukin-1 receptor domain-containing protein [Burkholderia contaminans]RQT01724.1 toll/interleukin-1 receptor domain-containing protein [Burkholderia contaminans]